MLSIVCTTACCSVSDKLRFEEINITLRPICIQDVMFLMTLDHHHLAASVIVRKSFHYQSVLLAPKEIVIHITAPIIHTKVIHCYAHSFAKKQIIDDVYYHA
jgi:hypothetical protein